MDSELPCYSVVSSESPGPLIITAAAAGPGSSSNTPRAGSQHIISLEDAKGFKWLTLHVNSRASTPSSIPIFYEGDVISGQVHFDVLKSESIKCISVKITAGTTFVGQEEQLFLNTEADLWTPSIALPDGSKIVKFSKGKYSWPFSLALPTEVEVQDQKTKQKFPLPTSFSESEHVDRALVTAFAYVPMTRSELPSLMLQKAYKENLPLVGPEGDPDGWHSLPPLTIQGKLFDSRTAKVRFDFTLAKPLTYGRGAPIPIRLTVTGNDEQALDLLSTPNVIKLLLVRSLATGSDATNDTEHRTDNCFLENVARAVFWTPEDYRTEGQRILQGEINVKTSLRPSTLFPRFTIRYHLDLQPFEVAGFVVTEPKSTLLLRQKVTIANFQAPGIPIRSHAPPEYVQEQGADYNKSVGLLENGNQRFFHHGGTGGI